MGETSTSSVETWFICWDDTRTEIKAYGSKLPNQFLGTPWNVVDSYLDETVWLGILLENNINPIPEVEDVSMLVVD